MNTLDFLKIFSEPLRLRMLALLKQTPLSVGELQEIVQLSQPNISHHLKLLKDNQLIALQKKGNTNFYFLPEEINLPKHTQELWQKINDVVKELPQWQTDERRLSMVLQQRKENEEKEIWQSWRMLQPDLPYTLDVALAALPKQNLAVDVGCGDGNFIHTIHNSFRHVIGIDHSFAKLKVAQQSLTYTNVIFLWAEAQQIPLPNAIAESVYMRMLLHFLREPKKIFTEGFRVLKRGGRMAIIDTIVRAENNDEQNSEEFSKKYFKTLCEKNPDIRLVEYKKLSAVFICVLEKK